VDVLARIRSLVEPPHFADEEAARRAAIVQRVTWALAGVAVLSSALLAVENSAPLPRLAAVGVFLAAAAATLALVRAGHVLSAARVFVVAGWAAVALGVAVTRTSSAPAMAGFVLAVTSAGLLLGSRAAFAIALLSALTFPVVWVSLVAPEGAEAQARALAPGLWAVETTIYFGAAALVSVAIRQTERALARAKQSETRFRALAENAGDMIFEIDEHGRFVYSNARGEASRLLQRFDDTLCGEQGPTIHPDDLPALQEAFREMPLLKGPRQMSCRIFDRGRTRWLDSTANAFVAEDGRAHVVVVSRDVTAQRETEAALRESEGRYRMLAEHAPDMIVEHDETGRIVYANARALSFAGWTFEQLQQMPLDGWAHPDDLEACASAFGSVLRERTVTRLVHRLRRSNGEYAWVESSGAPVVTASGAVHMIAQSRDLTEELSLQEQLRQAQKMEAIGRLAGGVAHDFNNLLTVIGGYAGLIESAVPRATPASNAAHEIQDATERAAGLTRQLVALSRRQLAERQPVDLNAAIRALEPVLRRALPASISLELSLDEGIPAVEADPSQVDQVLLNLALNARDAMRERGTLGITTRRGDGGRSVRLLVSDTGIGMDEATRSRAFEPFFTTKPSGFGSGLGLSTTYGIVRQSGGTIALDSAPGQGTRVSIELPATSGRDVVAHAARIGPGVLPLARDATILLVEDDASVRRLIDILLQSSGYRVIAAADASEALARSNQREVDLLLTDYVMPGQSGIELCAALRERWPALRVVLMTGHAEMPDDGELPAGIEVIAKPFTREQLGAVLARKLGSP
jgi:two-component system cell cycle sensor histidine kinase/response regulator CckA